MQATGDLLQWLEAYSRVFLHVIGVASGKYTVVKALAGFATIANALKKPKEVGSMHGVVAATPDRPQPCACAHSSRDAFERCTTLGPIHR
eukprot:353684-Chlamydomonas_euryale.AAC.11